MVDLKALMNSEIKFKQVWESSCKNHRVLYFQINNTDDGIDAHFHPFGEDHALVLEGELTYDISFKEQMLLRKIILSLDGQIMCMDIKIAVKNPYIF